MDIKNKPEAEPQKQQSGLTNEEVSKMISNAVAEALKIAIPAAAVGINQANWSAQQQNQERITRDVRRKTQRCPICLQPVSACGGPFPKDETGKDIEAKNEDGTPKYEPSLNHIKAFVNFKDESLRKHFDAIWINGVPYKSFRGEAIWIPKKSDILTQVNMAENNEKELLQKRSAEGQGAGAIGPGGIQHRGNPNAIGWR